LAFDLKSVPFMGESQRAGLDLRKELAGFVGVRGERRAEIGKARPGFSLEPVELDGIAPRTPGDAR
jgi:hypothetical protein